MTDKKTTLELLNTGYANFQDTIKGLDREQLERVFYGDWSVKDIVAHMLGWEREMTEAFRRIARGERPTPEGGDYSNSDEWNAKFSARMGAQLPTTVLAEWGQVHAGFVKAAQAIPDDRFGAGDDGKLKTVNRIIETTGYGHYQEHAPPIREWRQREGV
jgi:hypothetical protein